MDQNVGVAARETLKFVFHTNSLKKFPEVTDQVFLPSVFILLANVFAVIGNSNLINWYLSRRKKGLVSWS